MPFDATQRERETSAQSSVDNVYTINYYECAVSHEILGNCHQYEEE